ncbi:MAG: tandem-95 repeat protein, partial [Hyphomicrobium sp.]
IYAGATLRGVEGGGGNDTYFIDSAGDTIVEETRGGFDHVYSAVNYTLGSELEHLTLLGTALTGTGNALRNTLAGNAHDNILIAGTGDDTLAGNGGNDELSGGSGSDGYVYEFGDGDDVILELAGDLGEDLIVFVGQILPEEMAFFRDPAALDDLILRFLGGGSITITDYFATTGTTIEGFDFDAGPDWDTAEIGQHAATAILSANTGPIAADDSYVFAGANTFRLPVAALLENDSDRDGDQLSIISVTSSEGTAHIEGGEVVVTANAETTPRAVFDYIVSDSHGGTHTATVEISFWPNSAPVITSSELAVVAANTEATGLIVATDADGDALFYTVQTGAEPAKGTIAFAADGAFSYTPFANASGADAFTVLVSDTFGASAAHTFNVLIPSTNRAPEIISATLDPISEDTPANGVLVATDGDGDVLTYSIKAGGEPQKGSVVLAAGGTFTYSPSANANGSDSFTLVVTDTAGASAEYTFAVTIAPGNDAPVIVSSALDPVTEDTIAGGALIATDSDGDSLTYAIKIDAGPAAGTVTLATDGTFTYLPFANANGNDSFTLVVTDTAGASAEKAFDVSIAAVNDAPSAVNDTGFALVAGSSITIDGDQLLANDNDVDGDILTIVSAGTAIGGTVALDQSGNLVFTASANFSGQAAFTYGIADGQGGSASASVSLTVSPVTTPVGLVLKGTNHRDTLVGTQYHDVFYGKKGADILMGLGGDDVFVVKGDDGTDWIDGGEGHDSILGSTRNDTIGVSWNLGNLRSIEAILGGSGFDRIVATDGNDVLDFSGLTLQGIDRISLGDGNDRVKGSNSNDIFSGGDGRDTFVLTRDAGRDTIVDFDARQHGRTGDSIDVTAFQFANFAAVSSRMHQYGHNVVITLDAETSLTLKDVHIRDLGASDFRIL